MTWPPAHYVRAADAARRRVSAERQAAANMRWTGAEDGIFWEVQFWGAGSMNEGHGAFCAYLTLPEAIMPDDEFDRVWWLSPSDPADEKGRVHYDYYGLPADLDSEITYYAKEGGHDGSARAVKFGCDYSHLWHSERGHYEDADIVIGQIEMAAKILRERNPNWLWRSTWSGKYGKREDMARGKHGGLILATEVES